jgi:hypothetical protein
MPTHDDRSGPAPAARSLRGLLTLNGLLLLLLGGVTFGPSASAQYRSRGDYTMVAGKSPGAQSDIVYIVDTYNQELIGVTMDPTTRLLDGTGYRNLNRDAALAHQQRRPG